MPKVVLQVLLEPDEMAQVHRIAKEDASSASAAGRKLIWQGLNREQETV